MTRESLLGRDPSGTRSVLAWTARGAWSALCRCLPYTVLKQSSDIVASSGTMLAPALSKDREQQQQHILTPALAKAAPAQRHAHHCSICGAVRHTHAHTPTRAHTHTHANTHTHTHAHARIHTGAHTYIHMRTHQHTGTRTRTHTHAQTHRHTSAHKHTLVHAYTLTHTCICTQTLSM